MAGNEVTGRGRSLKHGVVGLGLLGLLAACAEPEIILPGERLDLRDGLPVAASPDGLNATAVPLPAPRVNAEWTHRGGDADRRVTHPALGPALTPLFSVDIGAGNSRRARITSDPVVGGGRIVTLDAGATVTATGVDGQVQWTADVTPPNDGAREASGGGVALGATQVYVSTGFGRVVALDAASGAVNWVQDLDAPGSAAPTVANGLVYVVARDGRAWAIDEAQGRVAWQLTGTPSGANLAGGSGAAVTSEIAVIPFPSGEVIGAFPQGGLRRWSSVIAGERSGEAGAVAATDIASDPVIDGATVYAGNMSGRVVAMNVANGERLWTATEGATSPVWPVGGSVFLINDLNQLVRLNGSNGVPVWRTQLTEQEERRWFQRITARPVHYGPILAGGRLIVASSDGVLRQFDPNSGASLGDIALPGGAASHPVVAGNTLYVISRDGRLHAYR